MHSMHKAICTLHYKTGAIYLAILVQVHVRSFSALFEIKEITRKVLSRRNWTEVWHLSIIFNSMTLAIRMDRTKVSRLMFSWLYLPLSSVFRVECEPMSLPFSYARLLLRVPTTRHTNLAQHSYKCKETRHKTYVVRCTTD